MGILSRSKYWAQGLSCYWCFVLIITSMGPGEKKAGIQYSVQSHCSLSSISSGRSVLCPESQGELRARKDRGTVRSRGRKQ